MLLLELFCFFPLLLKIKNIIVKLINKIYFKTYGIAGESGVSRVGVALLTEFESELLFVVAAAVATDVEDFALFSVVLTN